MTTNRNEETVRKMVEGCHARTIENGTWMRDTVILENGNHLALQESKPDEVLEELVDELFDYCRGNDALYEAMLIHGRQLADDSDFKSLREEALGWKLGMTIGTPDVPQEVVDKYIGVTYACPNCDGLDD